MSRIARALVAGIALTLPAAANAEDIKPILQDPERQEQRRKEKLAWNQRTLRDAYEKVGKKDPRWDADARAALEIAARHFSSSLEPKSDLVSLHNATGDATIRGCDDPLILYLHACSSDPKTMPGPFEVNRRAENAAGAMRRSAYPAFRRSAALLLAARLRLDRPGAPPAARAEGVKWLDAALALLAVSAAEDERSPTLDDIWMDNAGDILREYRRAGRTPEAALVDRH